MCFGSGGFVVVVGVSVFSRLNRSRQVGATRRLLAFIYIYLNATTLSLSSLTLSLYLSYPTGLTLSLFIFDGPFHLSQALSLLIPRMILLLLKIQKEQPSQRIYYIHFSLTFLYLYVTEHTMRLPIVLRYVDILDITYATCFYWRRNKYQRLSISTFFYVHSLILYRRFRLQSGKDRKKRKIGLFNNSIPSVPPPSLYCQHKRLISSLLYA